VCRVLEVRAVPSSIRASLRFWRRVPQTPRGSLVAEHIGDIDELQVGSGGRTLQGLRKRLCRNVGGERRGFNRLGQRSPEHPGAPRACRSRARAAPQSPQSRCPLIRDAIGRPYAPVWAFLRAQPPKHSAGGKVRCQTQLRLLSPHANPRIRHLDPHPLRLRKKAMNASGSSVAKIPLICRFRSAGW